MDNEEIMDEWEENAEPAEAEEAVTLKYMGEERTVGREEALALAQKGMDYDRIRGRYERLKTTAISGGDEAVRRSADIDEFIEDYPEVGPSDIPDEVWDEVRRGRSLSGAWARHENRLLRARVDELSAGLEGRARTTGARSGPGDPAAGDEFLRYLMN
jgi:hypothetical protein